MTIFSAVNINTSMVCQFVENTRIRVGSLKDGNVIICATPHKRRCVQWSMGKGIAIAETNRQVAGLLLKA